MKFDANKEFPTDQEIEKACSQWMAGYFSWTEDDIPDQELDSAREGFISAVVWIKNNFTVPK